MHNNLEAREGQHRGRSRQGRSKAPGVLLAALQPFAVHFALFFPFALFCSTIISFFMLRVAPHSENTMRGGAGMHNIQTPVPASFLLPQPGRRVLGRSIFFLVIYQTIIYFFLLLPAYSNK